MSYRVLAINPGSTSTKIAVYDSETPVFEEVLRHTPKSWLPIPASSSNMNFVKIWC